MIFKVSNHVLYKYQPSSGQSSSLLMKTSCLRLKLVELNFFASFTTDDQSTFNVSNTSKSSRCTFSITYRVRNGAKFVKIDSCSEKTAKHDIMLQKCLFSRIFFHRMSTIKTRIAVIETNNNTYCLQKGIEKFPLGLDGLSRCDASGRNWVGNFGSKSAAWRKNYGHLPLPHLHLQKQKLDWSSGLLVLRSENALQKLSFRFLTAVTLPPPKSQAVLRVARQGKSVCWPQAVADQGFGQGGAPALVRPILPT